LRDPAFTRFSRTLTCDRRTDGQTNARRHKLLTALASVARVKSLKTVKKNVVLRKVDYARFTSLFRPIKTKLCAQNRIIPRFLLEPINRFTFLVFFTITANGTGQLTSCYHLILSSVNAAAALRSFLRFIMSLDVRAGFHARRSLSTMLNVGSIQINNRIKYVIGLTRLVCTANFSNTLGDTCRQAHCKMSQITFGMPQQRMQDLLVGDAQGSGL